MDPDNSYLYEKCSGDMEISVGNKYRFKCYQFLEYPVVLVVFHLSLLVHCYPFLCCFLVSFFSASVFYRCSGIQSAFWNFWTALHILIKGTGYDFILPAVFWSACTLKHDCTRPYVYLNSIVCVESCYCPFTCLPFHFYLLLFYYMN